MDSLWRSAEQTQRCDQRERWQQLKRQPGVQMAVHTPEAEASRYLAAWIFGNVYKNRQAPVKFRHLCRIDTPKDRADLVALEGQGFVDHDLKSTAQAVFDTWLSVDAQERSRNQCASDRQYRERCVIAKVVGLNHQCRTRFPKPH